MKTSKSRHRKTSTSHRASSKRGTKKRRFEPPKTPTRSRVIEHEKKEWIDWIDKNEKIVGQVNKKFAHDYGIPHAVAHVIVLDSKNKLVVQKRGKWMFLQAGKWDDAVGGHITIGEKPEAAARREAMEEMHAKGKLHHLGKVWIHDQTKNYDNLELTHYFWMKTKNPLRRQRGEVEKIRRIPMHGIDAFIQTHGCSPWLQNSWKKFGKKIMAKAKAS